jgi:hypothetical protein
MQVRQCGICRKTIYYDPPRLRCAHCAKIDGMDRFITWLLNKVLDFLGFLVIGAAAVALGTTLVLEAILRAPVRLFSREPRTH